MCTPFHTESGRESCDANVRSASVFGTFALVTLVKLLNWVADLEASAEFTHPSTLRLAEREAQRGGRQYLRFCTSEASKASSASRGTKESKLSSGSG
jgi:hypothetical protein